MNEPMFPIQRGPAIPWSLIAPHDRQAQSNHGRQDLAELARRGGLSPCEAVAVLEDRDWHRMDAAVALARLNQIVDASLQVKLNAALARLADLEAILNSPEIHDFAKAVELEAAHQRARWGEAHDAEKTDADFFWVIGYVAGKALNTPIAKDGGLSAHDIREKQLHRIVTIAAVAANWHRLNSAAPASEESQA